MKFLCLICAETVMELMSESDARKHYDEYSEFTENVKKSGQYISANRLEPRDTAVTIRVREGKTSVVDGPFAETKEQLGGYYVIQAKDMNEAIRVAEKIPGAKIGCVEIRPIAEDPQTLALKLD
jgi:hypothetical protein